MAYRILLLLSLFSLTVSAQSVNTTFQRETLLWSIQPDGSVVVEHRRRSQFTYNDQGKLVERVLYKSPNKTGIPDKVIKRFASREEIRSVPGYGMSTRDFGFRRFGSKVEVKDTWSAHWPTGSQVKVYFSAAFKDDLPILIQAMDTWNGLVPEVQFVYAGTAEHTQVCQACLTVAVNPHLKDYGTFQSAERGDSLIVYARIELRKMDRNTLFSVFAHELGHGLSLDHSNEGLMRTKLPKGQKVFPSSVEVESVRRALKP